MIERTLPSKMGPVPQEVAHTCVRVPLALLTWGKHQPGGFSNLVRVLLKKEYDRQQKAAKSS